MRPEGSLERSSIGGLVSWLGPFADKAQRRCSRATKLRSRESRMEANTNRQDFSPHGRSWLASLHSQDEAFRNWPHSTLKVASFGELLPGDSFSSMDFVHRVTWGWPIGVSSGVGSAVPMSAEDGRPKRCAVVAGVCLRREKTPAS